MNTSSLTFEALIIVLPPLVILGLWLKYRHHSMWGDKNSSIETVFSGLAVLLAILAFLGPLPYRTSLGLMAIVLASPLLIYEPLYWLLVKIQSCSRTAANILGLLLSLLFVRLTLLFLDETTYGYLLLPVCISVVVSAAAAMKGK